MDDVYDDHRVSHVALLAPAASTWDSRILMLLCRAGERYVRIGFDPDPDEHLAHNVDLTATAVSGMLDTTAHVKKEGFHV